MPVRTLPAVSLTAALAALPLSLAGCASDRVVGGSWAGPKASDGTAESRRLVQNYLDAMATKDVAKGREQLCAPLRGAFDKTATSASGDFGRGFTVEHAKVTGVRSASGAHQVSATASVAGKSRTMPVNLVFTVTDADGWCIAKEALGGTPTPGPAAS